MYKENEVKNIGNALCASIAISPFVGRAVAAESRAKRYNAQVLAKSKYSIS